MKLVDCSGSGEEGHGGIYVVPAAYRGLFVLETSARRHFPRRALA